MKLTLHNISKSFGDLAVLNNLSLTLESGRIYCLMGPSGVGKTTLLRILMGLEKADSGHILIQNDAMFHGAVSGNAMSGNAASGNAVSDSTMARSTATGNAVCISAVFQEDRLCESFTPVDNVMMVTGRRLTRPQVRQELCRLLPEESLNRPVSTLSGGMKRRTAICRALLAPFDLLLMDEPFTGLDDDTKRLVIHYVQERSAGKLVLLTTHQIQDVDALQATLLQLY